MEKKEKILCCGEWNSKKTSNLFLASASTDLKAVKQQGVLNNERF